MSPAEPPGWRIRRVYEPALPEDGQRFLVDRLWPRGVSKERAALAAWLKPLAPSDGLRRRFHQAPPGSDPAWRQFLDGYFEEMDAGGAEVEAALATVREARAKGPVTFVYGAHDERRNNAVALLEWLARG